MANRASDWVTLFRAETTTVLGSYDRILGLMREYSLRWAEGLPEGTLVGANSDVTQQQIDAAMTVMQTVFGSVTPAQETALQVVRQ